MRQLDELFGLAQKHNGFLDGVNQDILRIRKDLAEKEKALQELQALHSDLDWSYRYLDSLVKTESNRFIGRLEEILNYGVKVIFDDKDYSIKITVEDNKRASLHLVYEDEDGNTVSPDVRDSVGGGVKTAIGVMLQVFFLFHYGCERLLILDEALSMLSSNYLQNMFSLLDELSRNNSLKILLITHDVRISDYASRQYVVENHRTKLVSK